MNFNLPFDKFKEQVTKKFSKYKWLKPFYKNECIKQLKTFKLNNTQQFVRDYFDINNPNGLMLYHSVGAGKTAAALSIAQKAEKNGFSVIWVTRTTLKTDLDKNLEVIPLKHPLLRFSYKQFSNLGNKKGLNYQKLVQKKGSKDILNKTLLIIDEVHKLYTKDLKPQEMHNIKNIENLIFNSYDLSNKDAVKVILMSATPLTEDPMELIKLLNLIIEDPHNRFNLETFEEEYIDKKTGKFTNNGKINFQEKVKDLVSYLDLSRDPRKFTQIRYHEVLVPISIPNYQTDFEKRLDDCQGFYKTCRELKIETKECQDELKKCKSQLIEDKKNFKTIKYQNKILKEKCNLQI